MSVQNPEESHETQGTNGQEKAGTTLPDSICAKCGRQVKLNAGDSYPIYYGLESGGSQVSSKVVAETIYTTTTHKYTILGTESVFICHDCFFSQALSRYRQNEITLFVTGVITLCLVIGIINIIIGFRERNKIAEIKNAISRNDKEKLRLIVQKNEATYYALPWKLITDRFVKSGHPYYVLFTPGQYAKLKINNS